MIKLLFLLSLLTLIACHKRTTMHPAPTPHARTVHLAWDASTTPSVSYNAYRSASTCAGATSFTKLNAAPITALTYDDLGVNAGTYCYHVKSYLQGAQPAESVASNQVEVAVSETQPSPPSNLTVTPAAVTLNLNQRQQFSAAIDGAATPAAWSINPAEGTIDAGGLYRAPSSIKGNNVKVQVTAHNEHGDGTAEITLRK